MVFPNQNVPPLFLASSSPQRRVLLEKAGFDFSWQAIPYEEDHTQGDSPRELVEILCRHKMATALANIPANSVESSCVLCSDTMVAYGNTRLGKPENREQAEAYLRLLSGKTHEVITGICLHIPEKIPTDSIHYADSVSLVRFRQLSEHDIRWYIDSNEWEGAAGAYRIQDRGACLIENLNGSWTGVMGLPLDVLYGMMSGLVGQV